MIQLNTAPPPLPETIQSEGTTSTNVAAGVGIALALVTLGGSLGYDAWLKTQEASPELVAAARAFVGFSCLSFALVGVICSIVSFFCKGSNRGSGAMIAGVLGVLLNAGVAGMTTVGGVATIRAQAASLPMLRNDAAALREFERTRHDVKQQLSEELERDGQITTEGGDRAAQTLLQGLDRVEKSTGGDTALAARAVKSFLSEMQAEFGGYQQEATKLINLNPMDPTRLKNKADLQMRQSVVASFQKRNDEVDALLESALPRLGRHLSEAGLSDKAAAGVMAGASKELEQRLEIIRNIRETDRRIAASISEILALYESHWQQWKTDPAGEVVSLEQADADAELKRLFSTVDQAAKDQAYWQSRYVKTL
ncbi:MAG TPA: hypothetical protein DCY13_16245 [Verrucomicrobiales bacterium]|nr:hypothetical protein [Verrucomicrobiales bacterium]